MTIKRTAASAASKAKTPEETLPGKEEMLQHLLRISKELEESKAKENEDKLLTFYLNNHASLMAGMILMGTVGELPAVVDGEVIEDKTCGQGLQARLGITVADFQKVGGVLGKKASRSGQTQLLGQVKGGKKVQAIVSDALFVRDTRDPEGKRILFQGSIESIVSVTPHMGGTPVKKLSALQIREAADAAVAEQAASLAEWRANLIPTPPVTEEEDTF